MLALPILGAALFLGLGSTALATPTAQHHDGYVDWKTFQATGVNLGGWLAQEAFIDPKWWSDNCGTAPDEWTCCVNLGAKCGPVLQQRYASFITRADIDKLASAGVSILRIPTSYAAWVKVPGSQLYSGNQVSYFENIAAYAIEKYGMHIILDLHSLPGGVNGLDIGEAVGHFYWFNNQTNLDYSLQAIDAALEYIQCSGSPPSYSLSPINEPADNRNFSFFGQPAALTDNGVAWLQKYIDAVVAKTKAVNPKIPVMFQGSFKGAAFWSPRFPAGTNIAFDVHQYFFAGPPTDSDSLPATICADAKAVAVGSNFPVFLGEWSIQTVANNKFANRAKNLNTGLYAWNRYAHGSTYWTAKMSGNVSVVGEGVQGDYWNFEGFIDLGIVDPSQGAQYCN